MLTHATDRALTRDVLESLYAGRGSEVEVQISQLANKHQIYERQIREKLQVMEFECLIAIASSGLVRLKARITNQGEILLSEMSKARIGFAAK